MTSRLLVDKIEGKASSGTVQMPSGSLVQRVMVTDVYDGSGINSTSWAEIRSDMRISITPKFDDSKLVITYHLLVGGNNSSLMRHYKIYNITSSADVNLGYTNGSRTSMHASFRNQDYDANDADMMTIQAVETSSSTVARTYGLYMKIESGSSITYHNTTTTDSAAIGSVRPMIFIEEIQA